MGSEIIETNTPAAFDHMAQTISEQGPTYNSETTLEIHVDEYLNRFDIPKESPIADIMHRYPVLVYGLGKYDEEGRIVDGTGIWNGPIEALIDHKRLIRHTVGTAVRAQLLASILNKANEDQLYCFTKQGFHANFFLGLSGIALRDSILISHYGALLAGQATANDDVAWKDRAVRMDHYLEAEGAHEILRYLQQSELGHVAWKNNQMPSMKERLCYPHIILTQIPDWWYDQKPIELMSRFETLMKTHNVPYLPILFERALTFEQCMKDAFKADQIQAIKYASDPPWAIEILDAYAGQAGTTRERLFES